MYYPLFVNLQDKRCVVIGAGVVAEKRVQSLIRHGASVCLVAPDASQTLRELAETGTIDWVCDHYNSSHLESAFLVVAATNSPEVNRTVVRDAGETQVLVTCADDPTLGNYITAGTVERGRLQIAVTSGGTSPTLTAVVKDRLAAQFGPEWVEWINLFQTLRADIQSVQGEHKRKLLVHKILNDEHISGSIMSGDNQAAVEEAKQCILSHLA
jgi:precorrin-2 dehydrogenase/sirohydrochlorin ferrochelatase